MRVESSGRPGSALLILGAIFATALFLRAPAGVGPAEPIATALDVEALSILSWPPVLPMHPPALDRTPSVPPAGIDKPNQPPPRLRRSADQPPLKLRRSAEASAKAEALRAKAEGLSPPTIASAATLEPIGETQPAAVSEMHQPEVDARRPDAVSQLPPVGPEPALAATSHGHMSGLANPVAPVSYVAESPSGPLGAVGTAFVKTGAALSLAFKKTGQGILAPF
jgi:hypothetical protein